MTKVESKPSLILMKIIGFSYVTLKMTRLCLGALDGMWQIVGFYLTWIGGKGRGRALGVGDVKFKGQVRPYHKKIIYCIDIKRLINKNNKHVVWADGTVTTDKNRTIYFAKNLQVGLFDNLTYDFGSDPSLDAF